MTRQATVVETEGKLMARITRPEACAKCGQCQHGREETRLYPLPQGDYKVGDTVEITVPDDGALPASVLAYGIPLVTLLLGLGIAAGIGLAAVWQAVCALVGTVLGFVLLRILEPRIRKNARFQTRVDGCPNQKK